MPDYAPVGRPSFDHALELLPSMTALQGTYYARYELLAGAVRGLTDLKLAV
jgi:hypothetical protein